MNTREYIMARKGKKRLSVEIPESLHRAFSRAAQKRCITITRYTIKIIVAAIKQEQLYE